MNPIHPIKYELYASPNPVAVNELMKWCGLNHLDKQHLENVKFACIFHDVAALVKCNDEVYLVGKNRHGSLGTGSADEFTQKIPKRVDALCGKKICNFVFGAQKVKNVDKVKGETLSVFALTEEGAIWAWGNNEHGNLGIRVCSKTPSPPQKVPISVMVIQLACGSGHALALSSEGFVWAWGRNFYGQVGNRNLQDHPFPVPIKISSEKLIIVRMVACGSRHSVILTNEGEVYAWGHNTKGQVGIGVNDDIINFPILVPFPIPIFITKIACGKHFTLALSSGGELYSWGSNRFGQLGNETVKKSNIPIRVLVREPPIEGISAENAERVTRVNDIAALPANSVGSCQSESLKIFMWGKLPEYPELSGMSMARPWDTFMTSMSDVFSSYVMPPETYMPLAAPHSPFSLHSLSNMSHQVALIEGSFRSIGKPNPIDDVFKGFMKWSALKYINAHYLHNVKLAFVCGSGFEQTAILITQDDRVNMFGKNVHGSFGTAEEEIFEQETPIEVESLNHKQIKSFHFGLDVVGGCMCIFALTRHGEIYSWGYNEYGELGHGDTEGPKPPMKIEGILSGVNIVKLAAGSDHTLAISDNGTLYSWGFNSDGQLGSGSQLTCEMLPKKVEFKGRPQTKVICAAAGMFHSAAVTIDGSVFAWGSNGKGQLGCSTKSKQFSKVPFLVKLPKHTAVQKIVCGPDSTFAITTTGQLYFWGHDGTSDNATVAPVRVCIELGPINDVGTAHWSSITACKTKSGQIYMWGKIRGSKRPKESPVQSDMCNSIQDVFAIFSVPPCTLEPIVVDD